MIYSLKIPRHRWVSIPLTPCQSLTGSGSGSDPWQALIKMWTGRLLNIQIVFFPLTPFFSTCENWNCRLSSHAIFLIVFFLSHHFHPRVKIEIVVFPFPPFFFPVFFSQLVKIELSSFLSRCFPPRVKIESVVFFSFKCFFSWLVTV